MSRERGKAVLNLIALGLATLFPRFLGNAPQTGFLFCFLDLFAVSKQIDGLLDASMDNDQAKASRFMHVFDTTRL